MASSALTAERRPAAQLTPAWREALAVLERDLRARACAQNTIRAYLIDCTQLASWASGRHAEPVEIDARTLRRWLTGLSEVAQAPTTVNQRRSVRASISTGSACR